MTLQSVKEIYIDGYQLKIDEKHIKNHMSHTLRLFFMFDKAAMRNCSLECVMNCIVVYYSILICQWLSLGEVAEHVDC